MSAPVARHGDSPDSRDEARPRRRLPAHCVRPPRPPSQSAPAKRLLRGLGLASVCEEARCPNRGECWSRGHVTFMLMGSTCTRACRFCAVKTGLPAAGPDPAEPERIARAAESLGLAHVVLTSVNRDDLPDGGASHFAATVAAIRRARPEASVEVLTPDFQGDAEAVGTVCAAAPDVFNHNVETVPRLYRRVRPGARFERSLFVLSEARRRLGPGIPVKSGLMVGLGEEPGEVREALRALLAAGVDTLTVGQYLQPTRGHLPVMRYWEPGEFEALGRDARAMGFEEAACGPLVRSSYRAGDAYRERAVGAGGAP